MSKTEMEKLYQKEVGKSAWSSWGSTECVDENAGHLEVYVEGPTCDYVKWLVDRASKSSKVANDSTSDNNERDVICSDSMCDYCSKIEKCNGFEDAGDCFKGRKLTPVS